MRRAVPAYGAPPEAGEAPGNFFAGFVGPIRFALGSSRLPKIEDWSNLLEMVWRQHIRVDGYADPIEGAAAPRLALERAQHVRAALIAHGADPSRLTAVGHGTEQSSAGRHREAVNSRATFTVVGE